eukprot:TRINITY_DN4065_c0_g1_i2.p1 TRINITY_DN4065_c0_g1~~TRINITY_DN4065_c0_g1_i2.p1  ORF type:complete len:372 (-),score=86.10 TRINITY_DN4065_c0_g1_i2:91-1206(-)
MSQPSETNPSISTAESQLHPLPRNHKKLKPAQLDIDDPTVGSFIYIPQDDESKILDPKPPSHEILRLGNAQESILILNDYKSASPAASDPAGAAPIILPNVSSDNTSEKVNLSGLNSSQAEIQQQEISPAAPVPSGASAPSEKVLKSQATNEKSNQTVQNLSDDDLALVVSCPLESITNATQVSVLVGLNPDAFEILESQSQVATIADLASLPTSKPTAFEFMKEIGVPPDISHLAKLAQRLLERAAELRKIRSSPPVLPPVALSIPMADSASKQSESSQKSRQNLDSSTSIKNQSISIIDGIKEGEADQFLEAHALIQTIGQLADFPVAFPGLYQVMKDSGAIPKLESFVLAAQMLVKTVASLPTAPEMK